MDGKASMASGNFGKEDKNRLGHNEMTFLRGIERKPEDVSPAASASTNSAISSVGSGKRAIERAENVEGTMIDLLNNNINLKMNLNMMVDPSPGAKVALNQGFAVGSGSEHYGNSANNSSNNGANRSYPYQSHHHPSTHLSTNLSGKSSPNSTKATGTSSNLPLLQQPQLIGREDDWGMAGLAELLRLAQVDNNLLDPNSNGSGTALTQPMISSLGYDPDSLGLGLEQTEMRLSQGFLSPWIDVLPNSNTVLGPLFRIRRGKGIGSSGASVGSFMNNVANTNNVNTVGMNGNGSGLEGILPACYNFQPTPLPGVGKVSAFSDETLFYMFYAMPRDRMQEIAAKELTNRGWRYHKEQQVWIIKEDATSTSGGSVASTSIVHGGIAADVDVMNEGGQGGIIKMEGGQSLATNSRIGSSTLSSSSSGGTIDVSSGLVAGNGHVVFEPKTWSRVLVRDMHVGEGQLEDRFLNKSTGTTTFANNAGIDVMPSLPVGPATKKSGSPLLTR